MTAAIDTDILIHFLKSHKEEILFELFDTVYLYQYLYEDEFCLKASDPLIQRLNEYINQDDITLIDDDYLESICMLDTFDEHVEAFSLTMDDGENYAYALGRTLGCNVLTTDDTKLYGPHHSLMNQVNTIIIPLAFYEVCFLHHLVTDNQDLNGYIKLCQHINQASFEPPMNIKSRLKKMSRRFSSDLNKKDKHVLFVELNLDEIAFKRRLKHLNQLIK